MVTTPSPRPMRAVQRARLWASSLLSWAEFMADEPVRPKSRSRKTKPASTSLSEPAFSPGTGEGGGCGGSGRLTGRVDSRTGVLYHL